MFQNIDLSKFNLPDSVIQKIQEDIIKKQSDLIAIKGTFSADITDKIIKGLRKTFESFWQENEIVFLQHGTTKEDVWAFSKCLMIEMFKNLFDRLIENSEEDIADENP